jgi:ribonuclease Z
MIEVIFLGTSSMFPTEKRAHSSIFIRDGPENILFDCGEGCQRQMRIAGISPMKVNRIFITHWHGDHALGLSGLIQSMAANKRSDKLYVYGPKGTERFMYHLLRSFAFDLRFKIEVNEIMPKEKAHRIVDEEAFAIEAFPLQHIIPCCGYSFIEKGKRKIDMEYVKQHLGISQDPILGDLQRGKNITYKGKKVLASKATFVTPDKKLVYIADTSYFKGIEKFAKDADILISEATYASDVGGRAKEYSHLTAADSAKIAKDAGAKKLILTHFSQRYTSLKPIEEDAKKVFPHVALANDFDKFVIN